MKLLTIVLVCGFLQTQASKILIINPTPAHSHFTLAFRLAEELASKNHQVTFMTPFPHKKPIKNLQEISLEEVIPYINELKKTLYNLGAFGTLGYHLLDRTLGPGLTEYTLNNTELQQLLEKKETFDVVIIEHYINEALVGLGYRFQAPVILLEPVGSCYRSNYIYGNPGPASYVPDLIGTYNKHMNFWQRVKNFIILNLHELIRELSFLPLQRKLFRKYITTEVELDDVLYNTSLILTTSHPSVTDAVPHLPNIIEIGGHHLSPPKKLSQDLQNYLDNAKEGVVVFSMGSSLNGKDLNVEIRSAILNSFAKINAKVLWKLEINLPEAPKNVKILSWLPQQDVLAHPNVRCFITHGGLLSNFEAVYHGVPLIGIPVFGDQHTNIASAVENGYALSVPLEELTEETFTSALNEMLNNPKYTKNVKQRSKFMHDQPVKPMDLAVYWIEHVIRNGGAPFLKSGASDLKWYQRELIDVVTFLGVTILIGVLILKWRLCGKGKGVQKRVSAARKNK